MSICALHPPSYPATLSVFHAPFTQVPLSALEWLDNIPPYEFGPRCTTCSGCTHKQHTLTTAPPILSFNIDEVCSFFIDPRITSVIGGNRVHYRLAGVSYNSMEQMYFVSRIIAGSGEIYVHDGMHNNGDMVHKASCIDNVHLLTCREYTASALIHIYTTLNFGLVYATPRSGDGPPSHVQNCVF